MKASRFCHWVTLVLILVSPIIVVFVLMTTMATASAPARPEPGASAQRLSVDPEPPPGGEALSTRTSGRLSGEGVSFSRPALGSADAGAVLEVFTNTWSYSTIGLVYDPDRNLVRYAHESQSSTHNPTVYDVTPVGHDVPFSFSLSAMNGGWPWQLDNRTGVGYDPVHRTYFVPDYNGDLSYADDNIVEVLPDGTILNAWEMDDEVGSNDSIDGSEIDSIIDIAVVPGEPPRYFVTAAYDDAIVYEVDLTRTGTLWTPNSWRTVAVYTTTVCDVFEDNLGIDYDAQKQQLYHSGWHTTTILVTDVDFNEVGRFDCPGAGGYNSGVTFIEGSYPAEVWVTDFSSDQTTRCEALSGPLPEAGWEKWVDGLPWTPALSVTAETSGTIQAVDVITSARPFTLTVNWDPSRLAMGGLKIIPPLPDAVTATGVLTVTGGEDAPELITITKIFLARPSTWTETTVSETLTILGTGFDHRRRPFTVTKRSPQLGIGSDYRREVLPGGVATFTLAYTNTGGFENDVEIRSTFPATAPLVFADPLPDRRAGDGSWAEWDVGHVATNDRGEIDVYVYVDETLSVGDLITIPSGVYDHAGGLMDTVDTVFEVDGLAVPGWEKTVGTVDWHPGISVTRQVSETFEVVDVISVTDYFVLAEAWDPGRLVLSDWSVEPATYVGSVVPAVGGLVFSVQPPQPVPSERITLTKEFTVRPCTWTQTLLLEQFAVGTVGTSLPVLRPVSVNKVPSALELDNTNPTPEIYGGETVTFVLSYGNTGGFEHDVRVRSDFPPAVSFEASDPVPSPGGPGGSTVEWSIPGGLTMTQSGAVTVTARITEEVPADAVIGVPCTILDHAGRVRDTTVVTYRVLPPDWHKAINDLSWHLDLQTPISFRQIITVTDVITTGSDFVLVDRWNADHLCLDGVQQGHGTSVDTSGRMTWSVPLDGVEAVTITRRFRSHAFTQTYTVLWEDLLIGGEEWERRPVFVENTTPHIIYLPLVLRG